MARLPRPEDPMEIECSFCGRSEDAAGKLIGREQTPYRRQAYICASCVGGCREIFERASIAIGRPQPTTQFIGVISGVAEEMVLKALSDLFGALIRPGAVVHITANRIGLPSPPEQIFRLVSPT